MNWLKKTPFRDTPLVARNHLSGGGFGLPFITVCMAWRYLAEAVLCGQREADTSAPLRVDESGPKKTFQTAAEDIIKIDPEQGKSTDC